MFKIISIISLNISRSQLCKDLWAVWKKIAMNLHSLEVPDSPNKWETFHGCGVPQMSMSVYTLGPHSYKIALILTAGNVTLCSIILIIVGFVDNFSAAKSKIQQQEGCTSVQVSSFQTSKGRHCRGGSSWHGPGLWYTHSDFCFSSFQLLFSK